MPEAIAFSFAFLQIPSGTFLTWTVRVAMGTGQGWWLSFRPEVALGQPSNVWEAPNVCWNGQDVSCLRANAPADEFLCKPSGVIALEKDKSRSYSTRDPEGRAHANVVAFVSSPGVLYGHASCKNLRR